MKTRIICILLSLAICLVPVFSLAEEATSNNNQNEAADEIQDDNTNEDIVEKGIQKVSGVKVTCSRKNIITVKWDEVPGAAMYKVYRWTTSTNEYKCRYITSGTTFVDDRKRPGNKYKYQISAVIGDIEGEKSDEKSVYTYVYKVKNLKATCKTITNNVKLSWSKVENATGYKVYRWDSKNKKYKCIKTTSKTVFTDKGKASKKKYKYKVAACQKFTSDSGKTVIKCGLKSDAKAVRTYGKYHGIALAKPLKKINVCSSFGWRWGRMHKGTDMKASTGTPIYAAADGTVVSSHGTINTMGVTIVIKHKNGVKTTYGHLSKRLVYKGEKVKAGEKIGLVGATGNALCSHLHFEVRKNGSLINPMKFY